MKAGDKSEASEKLIKAKNLAKKMRNEELLKKVLEKIKENGGVRIV